MVLGQYDLVQLVLSGTGVFKRAFMPVYILKKLEAWSGAIIAGQTNEQKRKDKATQANDHGRLR